MYQFTSLILVHLAREATLENMGLIHQMSLLDNCSSQPNTAHQVLSHVQCVKWYTYVWYAFIKNGCVSTIDTRIEVRYSTIFDTALQWTMPSQKILSFSTRAIWRLLWLLGYNNHVIYSGATLGKTCVKYTWLTYLQRQILQYKYGLSVI